MKLKQNQDISFNSAALNALLSVVDKYLYSSDYDDGNSSKNEEYDEMEKGDLCVATLVTVHQHHSRVRSCWGPCAAIRQAPVRDVADGWCRGLRSGRHSEQMRVAT